MGTSIFVDGLSELLGPSFPVPSPLQNIHRIKREGVKSKGSNVKEGRSRASSEECGRSKIKLLQAVMISTIRQLLDSS